MADATLYTPRFSFQKIGGSQEIEPADYNALLTALDAQVSPIPNTLANFTAGTGAAITSNKVAGSHQMLRLTLTNAVVSMTDALKYGSVRILTWPTTNLLLVNARFNLTAVKDGTGATAASTPALAVGSTAAASSTLATTAIDTIGITTLAATLSAAAQMNGPAALAQRFIAAGATNYLYLNGSNAGSLSGATGTLTVSGTVDCFFSDFGTYS